jgi:hypothetical protein
MTYDDFKLGVEKKEPMPLTIMTCIYAFSVLL